MTPEEVEESYKLLVERENAELSKLKAAIFRTGSLRLAVVLACVVLCRIMWSHASVVVGIISIFIVLFLFLMKYHNRLFLKKRYRELLVQNAENELKGMDYDFSAFDGAAEKADAAHSYSLDLDLFGNHSFFQSVNRTVTSFGKNKLADTLLEPFGNKTDITEHQEAVKELSNNPGLLNHLRATGQMNEAEDLNIHHFSQQFMQFKLLSKSSWKYFTYIAPVAFALSIASSALGLAPIAVPGLCWTAFFLASLAPMKDIRLKMNLFEKKADTLQTYSSIFKIIENEEFKSNLLLTLQHKIRTGENASMAIHRLRAYSNNLDQSSNILGMLILNPVFFWNIICSIKIEKWINRHKNDIICWLQVLADFDSLTSFAVYAYNHPDYVYPEVSETYMLEGKELGHPMLNRKICVRNDASIGKRPYFLVVTGANMAGKSTYLRTVGINLMLACAGAPVCAASLKFYPYRLVTNLRTSDSLADNESYFFAELKRLKMIIGRLQSGEPLLIILDEILKGTNSEDKQKGSIALMKQLISLHGNGIIATHDLVLGNLEKEFPAAIKNYRFEADIKDEHLSFTYKMREGVAQNMNASFLMKKMGITGL